MKAPPKGTPQYVWWLAERRATAQVLEQAFWRDVALPLSLRGYPLPRPQFRFHPTRRWALDYAYLAARVAVECDGDLWSATSAHTRGQGAMRDREKGNELACAGWRLIRLTGEMLADGRALEYVERALLMGTAA
jgi:very-short-patch-repair endonuclease